MNKIVLGKSTLPNLKNIKSKIGSTWNTNYKVKESIFRKAQKNSTKSTISPIMSSIFD